MARGGEATGVLCELSVLRKSVPFRKHCTWTLQKRWKRLSNCLLAGMFWKRLRVTPNPSNRLRPGCQAIPTRQHWHTALSEGGGRSSASAMAFKNLLNNCSGGRRGAMSPRVDSSTCWPGFQLGWGLPATRSPSPLAVWWAMQKAELPPN